MDRKSEYKIDSLFIERRSPRAMDGKPMDEELLFSLFEAARWAPSAYNSQPWRFIYSNKGTQGFEKLFNLLVPFNQSWCKNASVLCLVLSKKTMDNDAVSSTYAFDTGAAWQNMALQGHLKNLVVHGMSGFDYKKAMKEYLIPECFEVLAMVAIGHKAPADHLGDRELIKRELEWSSRKKVQEFAFKDELK
jgi:nitroreductase